MRKFQAGQRVIFGKDRRPGQAFTCEDLKSGLPFRPDPGQRVLQTDDQRLQSRVRRQNVRPRAEQIRRYPLCRGAAQKQLQLLRRSWEGHQRSRTAGAERGVAAERLLRPQVQTRAGPRNVLQLKFRSPHKRLRVFYFSYHSISEIKIKEEARGFLFLSFWEKFAQLSSREVKYLLICSVNSTAAL